ncbi:MAG: response regulator [Daejeonella sp.]|uniref:response regulator n=1 Tax=Daejeonella sp. TaxID=2805397 RepID=UPI003C7692DC
MKPVEILLVEDNEGDILLTTEALEEGKILNNTRVVRDGRMALDFLAEGLRSGTLPDLILLDVNLPRINGHEVLQYVKHHMELKHIPVIMLTTSSAEKDINLSYKNHANCYITKPVDATDFIEAISKIEDFWINIVQLPK